MHSAPFRRDLWVGLGNPENEYEGTYHNVGRLAFDHFLKEEGASFRREPNGRFEYLRAPGRIYVRSLVFMNRSGEALRAALKYFRRTPQDLLVFQDDSDLYLGDFKVSCGRGAAGHHGLESAIQTLGTKDFCRVRIGIRPEAGRQRPKAEEFVLRRISRRDEKTLQSVFKAIEKLMVKEAP